jgi:hypothetical protein
VGLTAVTENAIAVSVPEGTERRAEQQDIAQAFYWHRFKLWQKDDKVSSIPETAAFDANLATKGMSASWQPVAGMSMLLCGSRYLYPCTRRAWQAG